VVLYKSNLEREEKKMFSRERFGEQQGRRRQVLIVLSRG